ncbi:MAG TPA: type II secretion system F family protein [Gammaproteobacteria bacterium]|nr:type II secretion system F family protein [Gammaproteobacteria bacterium]
MIQFQYKAVDAAGKRVSGRVGANNDADLELRLKRMGLELITCRPARAAAWRPGAGRVQRKDLITFCFNMEQLTRAGVPLMAGLADLRDSADNKRFREVIAALMEDIDSGKTLSGAMAAFPNIFNKVFVNLVRAGEQSGTLPQILAQLTESLKWQDELAAQTKRILMYPGFVGTAVFGVVIFLMTYLVPQLVGFIQNMDQAIPAHTRALIAVSGFITRYWYLVIAAPPLLVAAVIVAARRSPRFRLHLDEWILRAWPVGPILRKILLARFSGNFALMYGAGVSVLECIKISRELVDNKAIEAALDRVLGAINEGESLSAAFQRAALFPPLVIRMLRVGESTGALDQALNNVGYFYNRDVKEAIDRVQAMIEPTLTVVLGLILGWVMISVLGPIYDILSKITA